MDVPHTELTAGSGDSQSLTCNRGNNAVGVVVVRNVLGVGTHPLALGHAPCKGGLAAWHDRLGEGRQQRQVLCRAMKAVEQFLGFLAAHTGALPT